MTTTLRPAGPEHRAADGARSREYTVCVNGRPVGGVRLGAGPAGGGAGGRPVAAVQAAADPASGEAYPTDGAGAAPDPGGSETPPAGSVRARAGGGRIGGRAAGGSRAGADPGTGWIEALAVDEPDRRRGRGTVAALAAEEILRSWGCTRVEVSIPEDAEHALRIASALGYVEWQRTLRKELRSGEVPPGATALPAGDLARSAAPRAALRPLDAAERASWPERGGDAAFPPELPDDAFLALDDGAGTAVGRVWLRPGEVLFVEVPPDHRGRGHARTLLRAAESLTRESGAPSLTLDVPLSNTPAVRLATALGYRPARRHLAKPLA